jgi:predicted ATPase
LFWELRATLSLARLKVQRGRRNEARKDLSLVYNRFTEGFASADVRVAKAMLHELSTEDHASKGNAE